MKTLKANTADGPDGTSTRVLKECAADLSPVLTLLFRRRVFCQMFPPLENKLWFWLKEIILTNNRPPAFTSLFSKLYGSLHRWKDERTDKQIDRCRYFEKQLRGGS